MPLPIALLRKMSANDGAMTTRKPASCSAHAACSRDEPQPKFTPATSTDAPAYCGWFSTNDGFALPVVEQERAEARSLDPLQELLRDDLIGVDVVAAQRRDAAAMHA